ncbi:DeoR/GlpR family DNA-binding transcription regulator [Paracoccus laeviglucosivorans]|uniref:Transcriptional regulator, DeoR family n=1 Tax=Paracoccus laeviglucosivorans TaxID=1197861 RepID=A0A521F2Y6_9RHOB|nr:DeoR/GlpR family DNA-binding transcription regulator [Paracoccus laeviglucosivorans]SMO90515.1 transcriptional regulator, DeoR family [Paracoccus laeviglucosivorans]
MWSHERQGKILEMLVRDGKVMTNQLADLFNVSRETVRRDLLEMEETGSLTRVHGGAIQSGPDITPEAAFDIRRSADASAKDAIGEAACALIEPGMTLMIDTGTTTLAFAHALVRRGPVRIITNSIEIAQLTAASDCETLLLGGRPHREVPGTFGEMTLSEVDRFLADMAIISPVGLHPHRGATDYELHEAELARAMMRRAKSRMILCHSAKIGAESRVAICGLDEIDHVVTDARPNEVFSLPRGQMHFTEPRLSVADRSMLQR